MSSFLDEIEAFREAHGLSERRLGVLALNDGKFVSAVRAGERSPTLKTVERVRHFMLTYQGSNTEAA